MHVNDLWKFALKTKSIAMSFVSQRTSWNTALLAKAITINTIKMQ